jgi:hypothetical protein
MQSESESDHTNTLQFSFTDNDDATRASSQPENENKNNDKKKPGAKKKKLPEDSGWKPWGCPAGIPLFEIRDTAWEDEDDKNARGSELWGRVKPREKGVTIDDDDDGVLKPKLPREYMSRER